MFYNLECLPSFRWGLMPLVNINSSLSVREVDYIITRGGITCREKTNRLKNSR
jgi:hypothetical protein